MASKAWRFVAFICVLSDIVATKEKLDRFMSSATKTLIFEYDLIKSVN